MQQTLYGKCVVTVGKILTPVCLCHQAV